jgi:peptidoglycan-associated lipoprotein
LSWQLWLAACNNPDRFGAGGPDGAGGFGGAGGIGSHRAWAIRTTRPRWPISSSVSATACSSPSTSTPCRPRRATLAGQAQWLAANMGYAIIIEGHADEQGTREYNLATSARAASAAQQFLISQGVAPNRIRTVSYGKERPVEVCSTEACYSPRTVAP